MEYDYITSAYAAGLYIRSRQFVIVGKISNGLSAQTQTIADFC